MATDNPTSKNAIIFISVIAIIMVGYYALTIPDRRTASEKVGDAIHDMDARQLEDRTPGQKLGDAIKDKTANPHQ